MALLYRAHFAFAHRPIRTSSGRNTSALFGFFNTLLEIRDHHHPTHLAVALDTAAPTPRHTAYPDYKAQREAMPEELSEAIPHFRRFLDACRIPVLVRDGFEADDLIGTLVQHAETDGFDAFMVTPDKDFGQLVTDHVRIWKPGRQGADHEILGPAEVCARWDIERVDQVIDMLGLMGDASDNIPGVPGIGEKTAARLLKQFGSLDLILAHAHEIKGKLGQNLLAHRDNALLSRQLATIITNAPLDFQPHDLQLQPVDTAAVHALCVEFEFNTLGRRLLGDAFSRHPSPPPTPSFSAPPSSQPSAQGDLFPSTSSTPSHSTPSETLAPASPPTPTLQTVATVPHDYHLAQTPAERQHLAHLLQEQKSFCFDTETTGLDPRTARLVGISFSFQSHTGWFVPIAPSATGTPPELQEFLGVLAHPEIIKIGHNLKFDLLVLRWHGVDVQGPFFDTLIAHALLEPEQRHGMDRLAGQFLGYAPIPIDHLIGPKSGPQITMAEVPLPTLAEYATEDADVTWQLAEHFRPLLTSQHLDRVFHQVEMPVLPALVDMEFTGVALDTQALGEFSRLLASELTTAEADLHRLAGLPFNVNSNKQLGDILFDRLRLVEKPRKTPSGQYATDENTLTALAHLHPLIPRLLEYRTIAKLKSTYTDALPDAVFPPTGRIHTTFQQAATATGRLSSSDPNLQNIPIRTERGQEIRRAFIARPGWILLSADYSQIELRIIAALSHEEAMIEAFRQKLDIHAATAARVFHTPLAEVTPEMRRRAKMVNFGIAYGISAFGLGQRLSIPRTEAAAIIDHYFSSYPGVRQFIDDAIASARDLGYAITLTGRRRPLPDVRSANATVRGSAERNAINTPIQGTAADMIKIAMGQIHQDLRHQQLQARLVLQVHDELVFELPPEELPAVQTLAERRLRTALPLPHDVPLDVEIGTGPDWLTAH
jgi:DNA polymerase-1